MKIEGYKQRIADILLQRKLKSAAAVFKLGGEKLVEEGAKSLLKLEKKIDTDKMFAPSFKMVLTAVGNMAYRRKDGVFVVPIGCLKH